MKKILCAVLLSTLAACGDGKVEDATVSSEPVNPSWQYGISEDKMYKTKSYWANIESLNAPNLQFPYQGGSPIVLNIHRGHGDKINDSVIDVMLRNGQFDCSGGHSEYNSCYISMQVDNEEPIEIRGTKWNCGSDQCLTLRSDFDARGRQASLVPTFLEAKKLTLRLSLYNFGSFDYEFGVDGLKWSKVDGE